MSFFYPKPKYELYSVKTTTLQKIENTFTLYFFSTHIFLEKIPKKYCFLQKNSYLWRLSGATKYGYYQWVLA